MQESQNKQHYKVFGNSERVRLLVCLNKHQSVTELLEKCTLSQSALSQHLKILKDAGMVTCIRKGKKRIYSVTNKTALDIAKMLLHY